MLSFLTFPKPLVSVPVPEPNLYETVVGVRAKNSLLLSFLVFTYLPVALCHCFDCFFVDNFRTWNSMHTQDIVFVTEALSLPFRARSGSIRQNLAGETSDQTLFLFFIHLTFTNHDFFSV